MNTNVKQQDYLVPIERHHQRLHNAFSFWIAERMPIRQNETGSYEDHMKHVATFRSVQGFWQVYNHLLKPDMLASQSMDLHLFKQGIKPMWEDPSNRGGGKWMFRMKKGLAAMVWEDLLFAAIGEQFDVGNEICGVVVSCRQEEDVVSVWNRTASNKDAKMKILDVLRTLIKVPASIPVEYKRHDRFSVENATAPRAEPPVVPQQRDRERERQQQEREREREREREAVREQRERDRDRDNHRDRASSGFTGSGSWRSDGEKDRTELSSNWRNRGGGAMERSDSMGSARGGHSPGGGMGIGMMERSASAGSYGLHSHHFHRTGDRGPYRGDPRDRGTLHGLDRDHGFNQRDTMREGAGEAGLNAGPGSAYGFTSSSSRMKGGASMGDRDHRDTGGGARNFDSFNRRDRGFRSY